MEQLGAQLTVAKTEISAKEESTAKLEETLGHERERCSDLAQKLIALEDEHRDTNVLLSTAQANGDNLQHSVSLIKTTLTKIV